MKNFFSVFVLVVFMLSLVPNDAEAQRWTKRRRYYSAGVSLNAMNYFGDIVPEAAFTSLRLRSTRPNIGVHYAYKMYPRFSVKGNLSWGRITGDDAKSASRNEADNLPRFKRNLSFRNDIKELSGMAVFDLYENRASFTRRPDFNPYGFIGLAVFHHNPKAYYGGEAMPAGWYALQPLGTEGQHVDGQGYPKKYHKVQIAIPFGVGFRYKLDRQWDLGFEITWRKTFTDYLDDVSTLYADKLDLANSPGGQTAVILSDRSEESGYPTETDAYGYRHISGYGTRAQQRGDTTDKDWYILTGFNINYILPARGRAPKFR